MQRRGGDVPQQNVGNSKERSEVKARRLIKGKRSKPQPFRLTGEDEGPEAGRENGNKEYNDDYSACDFLHQTFDQDTRGERGSRGGKGGGRK